MIRVPLREGRTLHHDVIGHYGAGRVVFRVAVPGTGIIAGGPVRAIFEALGVHDVVAKSVGTSNPHNMVKAAFAALGRAPRARRRSSPRQEGERNPGSARRARRGEGVGMATAKGRDRITQSAARSAGRTISRRR